MVIIVWCSSCQAVICRNSFKHHKHGVQENHVIKSLQERGVLARAVQMCLGVGSGTHSTAEAGKQTQINAIFECLTAFSLSSCWIHRCPIYLCFFCRNPPQCTYVAVLGRSFHHMWKALKPASCSFEPLPGWKLSLSWHRDDTNYGRVSTLCRMDLCVFGWLPSGFRCRLPQPLSLTLFSDWAEARPRVLALVALERTD